MSYENGYKYNIDDMVMKVSGEYHPVGKVKARWKTDSGEERYAVSFISPRGMVHILGAQQLASYANKYLPCAHCGFDEIEMSEDDDDFIVCANCGTVSPKDNWNNRV